MNRTKRIFLFLERLLDGITRLLWQISGALVVLMALVVFYGVVMRYFFRSQDRFSPEITTILMLACVFFAIAHTQRLGRHIRVDLMDNRLREPVRGILLNIVGPLMGLCYTIVLFWTSMVDMQFSFKTTQCTVSLLRIPTYPLKLTITIGAGLLSLVLIAQIIRYLVSLKNKQLAESNSD